MARLLSIIIIIIGFPITAALPQVEGGQIKRLENFKSDYVPARNIDIWLPPNYDRTQKYPVVYMHDGQMLFDAATTWNNNDWQVDEIVLELIEAQKIPPIIIVGIWNGGINRHSEYFPQKPFEMMSKAAREKEYTRLRGDNNLFNKAIYSDQYLKFIVSELKPYISDEFNGDDDNSYLMGSSMGGLISWYGLLEYPTEFKGAACLSTHWTGNFEKENNPVPEHFVGFIKKHIHKLTTQRLYFDHGTEGLDAMYPPIQAEVDRLLKMTTIDWVSLEFEKANHTEAAWAARLHLPLLYLLQGEKPVLDSK